MSCFLNSWGKRPGNRRCRCALIKILCWLVWKQADANILGLVVQSLEPFLRFWLWTTTRCSWSRAGKSQTPFASNLQAQSFFLNCRFRGLLKLLLACIPALRSLSSGQTPFFELFLNSNFACLGTDALGNRFASCALRFPSSEAMLLMQRKYSRAPKLTSNSHMCTHTNARAR